MRALIGLVATLGLLSAIAPATVSAARPTEYTVSQTFIGCDVSSTAGLVSLYAQGDDWGVFTSVLIWEPGTDPEIDMPAIISDASTVTLDGLQLSGSLDLVRVEESQNPEEPPILIPAGTAQISAELIPNGPRINVGSTDDRDGNLLYRSERFDQLYDLQGVIALDLTDGTVAELALVGTDCGASTHVIEWFGTNPNSLIQKQERVYLSCEWDTETGSVSLGAFTEPGRSLGQVVIVSADGALVGFQVPVLSPTTYQSHSDLFDAATRETVGTATAEATLSPSGRITEHERVDQYRYSVVGDALHVEGTLTIAVGSSITTLVMDDTSCDAGNVRIQLHEKMGRS